jgi:hypothetical protein
MYFLRFKDICRFLCAFLKAKLALRMSLFLFLKVKLLEKKKQSCPAFYFLKVARAAAFIKKKGECLHKNKSPVLAVAFLFFKNKRTHTLGNIGVSRFFVVPVGTNLKIKAW